MDVIGAMQKLWTQVNEKNNLIERQLADQIAIRDELLRTRDEKLKRTT